jgi:hypothetical protein
MIMNVSTIIYLKAVRTGGKPVSVRVPERLQALLGNRFVVCYSRNRKK